MRCTFDKLIYEDKSTSFSVVSFRTRDPSVPEDAGSVRRCRDGTVRFTAIGYHLPAGAACDVDLEGDWQMGRHGLRLSVTRCTEILPETEEGIAAYLSSGLIRGIGPKRAKAIVSRFGTAAFDIMEHEPERLTEIKGITEKNVEAIAASYRRNREIRDIVSWLGPYGISVNKCARIREAFGAGAVDILKNSPFRLCGITGFGFRTVDDIARRTSYRSADPLRIRGALGYVLDESAAEGNLYLDRDTACRKAYALLNEGFESEAVPLTLVRDELFAAEKNGAFVCEENCLYLPRYFCSENETAKAVSAMLGVDRPSVSAYREIIDSCGRIGIVLTTKQLEAVEMCLNSRLSVVTGGPGTGKTTVLKVILDVVNKLYPEKKILLAAPTGRAARRMEESTGRTARTLHAALGLMPDGDVRAASGEKIDGDFVIVDEASMLDMTLAKELFTRLRPDAALLLVGDSEQLPSVGAGSVLREFLKCGEIPVTALDLVFRQDETSRIALNAKAMREGDTNLLWGDDFAFREAENEEQAAAIVSAEYVREVAEKGVGAVQILAPFRSKGEASVNALNARVRELVNPPSADRPELGDGTTVFRLGDRVMQTRNTGDISNGDVGFVTDVSAGEDNDPYLTVTFGSRTREYGPDDFDMLAPAFAMTVHKSQGGEYDTVIMPILASQYIMLRRNLIYTAVTRAKKKVILVGEKRAVFWAIHKSGSDERTTKLAERIGKFRKEKDSE